MLSQGRRLGNTTSMPQFVTIRCQINVEDIKRVDSGNPKAIRTHTEPGSRQNLMNIVPAGNQGLPITGCCSRPCLNHSTANLVFLN